MLGVAHSFCFGGQLSALKRGQFMSVDFIFRLLGMLVFGLGGFYLGQALIRAGGISLAA